MGLQKVQDVTLIRHAYVAPVAKSEASERTCSLICGNWRTVQSWSAMGRRGLGDSILRKVWLSNSWSQEKNRLLKSIDRARTPNETSVVMADPEWREIQR